MFGKHVFNNSSSTHTSVSFSSGEAGFNGVALVPGGCVCVGGGCDTQGPFAGIGLDPDGMGRP